MNGKVLLLLGMAGLCGLMAMMGVKSLLSSRPESGVPMQEVLVAAREIRVEETMTAEMVRLESVPVDQVPPGSFTSIEQIAGRWAKMPMLEGDPIREDKLAEKGMPTGMLAKVTPGKRAFAINVDEQRGVSGFILPDYRVDVVQSHNDGVTPASVVVEDVRVLASGNVIESPEDRSIQARTVTLEVTPDQVRLLAGAMQRGPLMLTLRGMNDHERVIVPEPEPEPVPEPEPEPEPEMLLTAAEPAPPSPRWLTIFHGRSTVEQHQIGGDRTDEGDEDDGLSARRPFALDGLLLEGPSGGDVTAGP